MTLAISSNVRAAANRALMAGSTEYFSWTAEAQERFRAAAGKEARRRMEQVLLSPGKSLAQHMGVNLGSAQICMGQ
jgi:hypothetical protein